MATPDPRPATQVLAQVLAGPLPLHDSPDDHAVRLVDALTDAGYIITRPAPLATGDDLVQFLADRADLAGPDIIRGLLGDPLAHALAHYLRSAWLAMRDIGIIIETDGEASRSEASIKTIIDRWGAWPEFDDTGRPVPLD